MVTDYVHQDTTVVQMLVITKEHLVELEHTRKNRDLDVSRNAFLV